MTLIVENGRCVQTSFINAKLADELYLFMAPQLIDKLTSLFMDETRHLMAESELLRFIDVHKIGEYIRLYVKFLKEE
ncbi:hypothetical protein KSU66_13965 [Sporosarcina sp. G11-34]|nr:hypothetical protein [Sporosarcina sp. G11-34]